MPAELLPDLLQLARLNVHFVQVPSNVRQRHEPVIHHAIPKPGYVGDQVDAKISAWQRRQVVEVTQRLITTQRMRVVVGVALQMKQNEVAVNMVTVPRMAGLASFISAIFILRPQQPVVLDIVCAGELPPCQHVVDEKKGNHFPTESDQQAKLQNDRQEHGLQNLVAGTPR